MKKLFIFLVVIICYTNSVAQILNSMTVSPLANNNINVNVNVFQSTATIYLSYTSSINGDVVELNVCYHKLPWLVVQTNINDFQISLPAQPNNYTLKVFLNYTMDGDCSNAETLATDTLQFSTPLTDPVILSASIFDSGEYLVRVSPNPTQGIITLDFGNKPEAVTVSVANTLGQEISRGVYAPAASLPIMIEGVSGVYFVTVSSSRGSETFKVVKQ